MLLVNLLWFLYCKIMQKVKIKVQNLRKTFGVKPILRGIDFEIYEGESLVILGESGCGKTIFSKLISGLIDADIESKIFIDGHDICFFNQQQKLHLFNKIAFAFQLNALFDSYSIWQNICFKAFLDNKKTEQEMKNIAINALEQVGLNAQIADMYPQNLSGGMQKRVAIARALVTHPEIIFFDEPTSGLDPLTSDRISDLIKNCKVNGKNATKISIMHDIKHARIVADRIVFFKNGLISWCGKPSEIELSGNKDLIDFVNSGE